MEQIDPTIKNLVSAIGKAETGKSRPEAYTQKGDSGEFGRYQFMPDTYKAYAKKYLGDGNAEPTIENQNKIAYAFVKEKKEKGFNPAQIASMWNAGEGRPDAYKENHKGVNSKGVAYDTPAYVKRVSDYYRELSQTPQGYGYVQPPELQQTETPLATPQTHREDLLAQGQPVSVNPAKAEPSIMGSLIRSTVKPFAQVGTSLLNIGQTLTGAPTTEPFSSDYLGKVEPVGKGFDVTKGLTKENVGAIGSAVGTGLSLGTTLGGGGSAERGAQKAVEGLKFTTPVTSQIAKGALQGSIMGTAGSVGTALSEKQPASEVGKAGLFGAVSGGLLGGILGAAGGILSKKAGITPKTQTMVQEAVEKNYIDDLSKSASGRKILAEQEVGRNLATKAGIYPSVKNGLYDSKQALDTLDDAMKKLGKARGEEIKALNKVVDTDIARNVVLKNVDQYVADPIQKKEVGQFVNKWFNELGPTADLKTLDSKQIATGQLAKFQNTTDANIRKAYRSIYHGLGEFLNDRLAPDGGVRKEVNDVLSGYHAVADFLDSINGKKVESSQLVELLTGEFARKVGTGVGGVKGLIMNEALRPIQRTLKGIFGNDRSSYSKVMDAINKGEMAKVEGLLKKIEETKGSAFIFKVRNALKDMPQLPAPAPGATTKGINIPIKLPAKSATTLEKESIQNIQKGLLKK